MKRWLLVLAGCAQPAGTAAQAVTNGSADPGDPAVIGLVDGTGVVGCTATVIEAHTAITAAHCIAGRVPVSALFGDAAADGVLIEISGSRVHPDFDPASLANDLALVTLRDPSPAAALMIEPSALDAALVGTSVRVVGFGTTGASVDDGGQKRTGTAKVSAVDALAVTAVPDPAQPCRGDSGGPLLLPAGTLAAVVSQGDTGCSDHAIFSRIDVAVTGFVDPYLADTAPATLPTGAACLYDGECASGPCLGAADDPLLFFCSQPCAHDADCPAQMTCASDGCRYPEPSPGALGSQCATAASCTSLVCRDNTCTRSCLGETCPADFECRGAGLDFNCFPKSEGCGGCGAGGGPGWLALIALVGFARGSRSDRSRARGGNRFARSRRARGSRAGS